MLTPQMTAALAERLTVLLVHHGVDAENLAAICTLHRLRKLSIRVPAHPLPPSISNLAELRGLELRGYAWS